MQRRVAIGNMKTAAIKRDSSLAYRHGFACACAVRCPAIHSDPPRYSSAAYRRDQFRLQLALAISDAVVRKLDDIVSQFGELLDGKCFDVRWAAAPRARTGNATAGRLAARKGQQTPAPCRILLLFTPRPAENGTK